MGPVLPALATVLYSLAVLVYNEVPLLIPVSSTSKRGVHCLDLLPLQLRT